MVQLLMISAVTKMSNKSGTRTRNQTRARNTLSMDLSEKNVPAP